MKPHYEITANGQPITGLIAPILNSLTVTDETGDQADRLSISLDDSAGTLELPKRGAILTLKLGIGPLMVDFGRFTVDAVVASGPPDILRIEAHAAPMAGAGRIQQRKSRSWENLTLLQIVKMIAAENGLQPVIGTGFSGLDPGHLDQTDESDISFLARVARDFSAVVKISSGRLAFIARGVSMTASGKPLPAVVLNRTPDISNWSATFADRDGYKSVVASYRDLNAAASPEVLVGEGEPAFRLPHTYSSESSARRAAISRLDDFARGAGGRVQLVLPPRLDIIAETPVTIAGVRNGVDGSYIARRVEHTLTGGQGGGLRTRIDCEKS